ncbi:L-rhamnose isomerase [Paenibacillus sacheonensis]|uniref:L-rhamnose isomerase n=1 Tax=Paenibacillus sacheonensis TaxID=742054 RepID=A0A7X4YLT8_9BACL|nr:L-rhamnose isomerase [Paenibacillus sacheonensis]MBM7565951.1 L-rhamnose isomerase/sugar isomerase [Paenibacillus sacheonensis]NBC68735.1 L-rhamnose isomerase [Paenibacillus sacheonensis]
MSDSAYAWFEREQQNRGIDVTQVKERLNALKIETPSWGYADQGTRFRTFKRADAARTVREKLEDAAAVHRFTGACPDVAIHIPWDHADDFGKLAADAKSLGIGIGAVNPNLFQDDEYMLGSVTNADPAVRARAVEHLLACVDIARATGSKALSLWFADGTNYPGQGDFRQRKAWMEESLRTMYAALDADMRMLIEYKFFEPGFYHTDLADWGMAYNLAQKLGPKAEVLVDTGHHPQGTNIEHIVAYLLDEGRLGGFHFNARKYADDDLIVGSANPYELFLIFAQIALAERDANPIVRRTAERIAYMIDQSHNIEAKIPAMIRSVMNVQTQYAKALLVDWNAVAEAQRAGDVLEAEAAVREAFEQNVTPLLQAVREEAGLPADPMAAYKQSGYAERIWNARSAAVAPL